MSTNDSDVEVVPTETNDEEFTDSPEGDDVIQDDAEVVQETPEAKRARLQRQLKQHDKKFGFTDEPVVPKPEKKEIPPVKEQGLTQKDVLVLAKATLHEEDIDEVIEYASYKKISISEALKSSTLKGILATRTEERATANAANVGNVRRTTNKMTDQAILDKASKGEIPDAGSEEAERLFWAKRGGKR